MRRMAAVLLSITALTAAEHTGQVKFGGLPVPGAGVTLSQGTQKLSAVTNLQGAYAFTDIADGPWTVHVDMQLFQPQSRDIAVPSAPLEWELTPLPADQLAKLATAVQATYQRTEVTAAPQAAAARQAAAKPTADPAATTELAQRAAESFLVNGSMNNGASSPFAQLPAFGNQRRGQRSLYNGNLGLILNNAAVDARAFSLTGQETPKPAYSRIQGLFSFGGPIRIPHLIRRNGPNFTVNYQWTRNSNATTQTGLMPTAAERTGTLARTVIDPGSGLPFPGNVIPANRISQQAITLLALYPQPNFAGNSRYNVQLPIISGLHQDDLQTRVNKQRRKHFFSGNYAWRSTRTDGPDLFGFLDTGRVTGINTGANYRLSFSSRSFLNTSYSFSRFTSRTTPYFAGRRNVSAEAGITGNNQDPANWGPPALNFSSGVTALSSSQNSLDRNQTHNLSADVFLNRSSHNITSGVTQRWLQFNVLSQQEARGSFAFTGATTQNDFGSFLLGRPDTSSIAFGNADKYLRAKVNEAFVNDDWRVHPGFTINAGLRWEYWSPVTEKYGRLVNLNIAPGFASASAVVARTAQSDLFPRPDRNNVAPRLAFSWRPFSASSMVVRGGYGIYYDTSVYQSIAMRMSQQSPLSKSLRVSNSAAAPLTLSNGFTSPPSATESTTFAIDPGFQVGMAQTWQLAVQSDLPAGMQATATYAGSKGTHAQQQILPNTFPNGASGPSGYTYLTSNGVANRHSLQAQVRRRLRNGFTANATYTLAKAEDNAAPGGRGFFIAQNWLDLRSEFARSNFDQRHLLATSVQYTTGMGLKGGSLVSGWRGLLLKEWTLGTQINVGGGLPLTPIYSRAVLGTGVTGTLRPDVTGADLYNAPAGFHLNPAAFTAPAAGKWGNAARNSINGPGQFTLNSSMSRTFRSSDRTSMDFRIDAANALNTVRFSSWNTIVGNAQFGLPNPANPMRSLQAVIRMRF